MQTPDKGNNMQMLDNPLMETYKTIRRYGTIVYDNSTETGNSRLLFIIHQDIGYLIRLRNGEVKYIRML